VLPSSVKLARQPLCAEQTVRGNPDVPCIEESPGSTG
jgi:hypothetical protein